MFRCVHWPELTQQLGTAAATSVVVNPAVLTEIVMDLNGSYQAMFLQYQKVFEQARQHYEGALSSTQQQAEATGMRWSGVSVYDVHAII